MDVTIAGIGLLCPAGIGPAAATGGRPGEVPDFQGKAFIANKKSLKLMSRSVQLGVSSVAISLGHVPDWAAVPPTRRAMFVGANPVGSNLDDMVPALDLAADAEGRLDLERFGRDGIPRIHPLWLVKGLSNNVLGYASAIHDFQGANANYCQDDLSGLLAVHEALCTLHEGRADLAVAGAADSLVGADPFFPGWDLGEGAAFFVLRTGHPEDRWQIRAGIGGVPVQPDERSLGYLGVAGGVVALARALLGGVPTATLVDPNLSITVQETAVRQSP